MFVCTIITAIVGTDATFTICGCNIIMGHSIMCMEELCFSEWGCYSTTRKNKLSLCLGRAGNVVGMGWDVKPFNVPGSKYKGFAVGAGDMVNDHATWLDPQEIDDFMFVPTDIISPLRLFIAAKKKVLPESGGCVLANWR